MIDLVTIAALLLPPAIYLVLQVRALLVWHGGFRWAATLPLAGWAIWAALFARDVAQDPTSHNLFPFEIVIGSLAALVYLLAAALARRFRR